MCCLVTAFLILGPRATIFFWWLLRRPYWTDTLFPGSYGVAGLLGFLFLPWTTLAYGLVAVGGVSGLEWLLIFIGLMIDLGSGGGAYRNRDRVSRKRKRQ